MSAVWWLLSLFVFFPRLHDGKVCHNVPTKAINIIVEAILGTAYVDSMAFYVENMTQNRLLFAYFIVIDVIFDHQHPTVCNILHSNPIQQNKWKDSLENGMFCMKIETSH